MRGAGREQQQKREQEAVHVRAPAEGGRPTAGATGICLVESPPESGGDREAVGVWR
jgi:hypothetical protein